MDHEMQWTAQNSMFPQWHYTDYPPDSTAPTNGTPRSHIIWKTSCEKDGWGRPCYLVGYSIDLPGVDSTANGQASPAISRDSIKELEDSLRFLSTGTQQVLLTHDNIVLEHGMSHDVTPEDVTEFQKLVTDLTNMCSERHSTVGVSHEPIPSTSEGSNAVDANLKTLKTKWTIVSKNMQLPSFEINRIEKIYPWSRFQATRDLPIVNYDRIMSEDLEMGEAAKADLPISMLGFSLTDAPIWNRESSFPCLYKKGSVPSETLAQMAMTAGVFFCL